MHQEQPVGWDPIGIDYHAPLASRLFFFYLIVVVAIWLARFISATRQLRPLKHYMMTLSDSPKTLTAWRVCWGHLRWMKRLTVLTAFVAFLSASWQAREALVNWVTYKTGPIALAGAMAEVCGLFALGMLVCAVTFAAYVICDGILMRRTPISESKL